VNHLVEPLALWLVAATGQTTSHGAFSQCMQVTGWWIVSGFSSPPA
jgi:hypothetical protein